VKLALKKLLQAHPSIQVSTLLSGSLSTPSAKGVFVEGDFDSISTVTVGAGGSTSIAFTSIPATYKHLQIRASARNTTQVSWVTAFFNSDTTTSNYKRHTMNGNGSTVSSSSGSDTLNFLIPTFGDYLGMGIIDILDYADTNKYTTTRCIGGYALNGSGFAAVTSNVWKNTAAVTSITLNMGGDTFGQYSSFALYGIKGA
jgi:hypothetical protein